MDDIVHVKLEWGEALRRATVTRQETLAGLKRTVCSLLGLEACELTYRDEEGDVITVGSDFELKQLIEAAVAEKRPLRFVVVKPNAASPTGGKTAELPREAEVEEEEEEEEQEEEIPFAEIAKAFSDPETIQRIQLVFQSPIITEAVVRFAQAYLDNRGDVALASLASAQSIPALLGLLAEVVHDLPVLKDLQQILMQHFMQRGPASYGCQEQAKAPGVGCHFGVVCDGCASDRDLKAESAKNGHISRRGFIRGTRYKSQTISDFDLCETCKQNTTRFPDSAYGPFTSLSPPGHGWHHGEGPRRGWGWRRHHHGGGMGGPDQPWWRPHPHGAHPHGAHPHGPHPHGPPHHPPFFAPPFFGRPPHGVPPFCARPPHCQPQASQEQQEDSNPFSAWLNFAQRAMAGVASSKNGEDKDELGDIAKAIAESLKEIGKAANSSSGEKPQEQAQPVEAIPVAVAPSVSPTAEPKKEDAFTKWAPQLQQLQVLGFDKSETYIGFLEEENGDLERVVNRIVRRDM